LIALSFQTFNRADDFTSTPVESEDGIKIALFVLVGGSSSDQLRLLTDQFHV
jgi:hypothetical protein